MEIEVDKLEDMTQEELESMQDAVVAEDEKGETEEKVEPPKEDDPQPETTTTDDEAGGAGDEKEELEPEMDEDLQEHISPPEKWIQKRIANREAQQPQEEVSNDDELGKVTAELDKLKQQIGWLKDSGVDVKQTPLDKLSDEKIEGFRKEFGDEIADAFQAVKSLQPKAETVVEQPKVETPKAPNVETTEPVNAEMETAIDNNNDLSYWREKSPALWERAVAKNEELLASPDYQNLPFADRFNKVVESVKVDALKEAKEKSPEAKDSDSVPASLSGTGASPTQTNESILDRLDNATPEEAEKIYRGLSEAERDKVDIKLGI